MFILPSLSFFSPPPLIISYFPLPIPIFSSFLFITLSHVLLSFFYFFLSFFFPSRITEKEENIFSSNQTMISRQWQEKEKLYFQYSPDYFSQYSRFAIFPPAIFSTKGREMKRDRFREERSDRTKKIVEGEGTAKMRQKRCDL